MNKVTDYFQLDPIISSSSQKNAPKKHKNTSFQLFDELGNVKIYDSNFKRVSNSN